MDKFVTKQRDEYEKKMQKALDDYKKKVSKIEESFVKDEQDAAAKHKEILNAHKNKASKKA